MLLDVMKDGKFQIFFSFMAIEETTFNSIATSGTDKFIDKCTILTRKDYSEFAIPYVPNFTIIQKGKSGVVIDMNIHLEIIEDAILKLVWRSGNSAIKRTSMLNNNIFLIGLKMCRGTFTTFKRFT